MSGVAIVRSLLAGNAPLITVVPAARIMAGLLPQGIALPAIAVTSISSMRRNTVSMAEATTLVTERVQVALAVKDSSREGGDYPQLTTGMRLIRQACPNQHGTINGFLCDSILPDIEGPDLDGDEPGMMSRSQDLIVKWVESR